MASFSFENEPSLLQATAVFKLGRKTVRVAEMLEPDTISRALAPHRLENREVEAILNSQAAAQQVERNHFEELANETAEK